MKRRIPGPWAAAVVFTVAAAASGCAFRFSDAHGRVTTVGLVWTTHPAPVKGNARENEVVLGPRREPEPPRWVEMRAVGVVAENTPNNAGLTLGYKESLWVFPHWNTVTDAERTSDGRVEMTSRPAEEPRDDTDVGVRRIP
jgi:hypothetical protein